jgi:hypothetical protein
MVATLDVADGIGDLFVSLPVLVQSRDFGSGGALSRIWYFREKSGVNTSSPTGHSLQ